MTDARSPRSLRSVSLVTGLCYLVTHVTSVAAAVLLVSGATATAVRASVLLELALAITVLVSGLGVRQLLCGPAPLLAGTFSGLRTLEAAVIAAGTLPLVALDAMPASDVAYALHAAAFMVGQSLIISVNTLVLGALLLRTRAVPRWIAWLGAAGGAIVLASNLAQFWGVLTDRTAAGLLAAPVFAFEISFALFLIVRGAAPTRDVRPLRP